MKTVALSAVLSGVLFSTGIDAALKLDLHKVHHPTSLSKRHILPRQNVNLELLNNITGGSYAAQIAIGSPPQPQNLAIDTGSSDVWFLDSDAPLCVDRALVSYYGGCSSSFDTSRSSSVRMAVENGFNISYLDGSGASGDYIQDDVHIGNDTVQLQQVGLAHDVTVTTGIMGIGFRINVASNSGRSRRPFTYPTIIDQMFDQGLIKLKAYSLYLDSKDAESGSVLFGGLDADKYIGNLFQLPLVPSQLRNGSEVYDHFTVVMTGLRLTQGSSSRNLTSTRYRVPVVLDSGTTLTYLPDSTTRQIYTELGAVDDTDTSGLVYVDCDLGRDETTTFSYFFGDSRRSVEIKVPISELLYSLSDIFGGRDYTSYIPRLPFRNVCAFGIMPSIQGISLLGDTFLRSAYVVYDLSNNVVAMAQANLNSQNENIVEFEASATSIPRVSGVASDVEATQTATFVGGPGNNRPTGRPTSSGDAGTVTVTSTPTNGANAAAHMAFDMSAFYVVGFSAVMAVLGGGLFLA